MIIAVIDGQGGGIGKALVEKIREAVQGREDIELRIIALGTNSLATAAMLKAGADAGASGENAIIVNAAKADVITGAIGILAADSMLGEVTAEAAAAIARSSAEKVLIPMSKCGIIVAGLENRQLMHCINDAVGIICNIAGI